MQRQKISVRGAAVLAAALMVVAACGSGDGDGGDAPSGSNVATGEPITIGAMAPSNGAAAYVEVEYGIQAAEWYINNELGGINGRPIEVDICQGNGSPETAVACANGFVEKGYPVVLDGYDSSFGGARPILLEAGIPWAGTISGDPANETVAAGSAFYFTGPLAITAAGLGTVWETLETKAVNLTATDTPAARAYVDAALLPLAEALDVEASLQYVDETKANWNALAAALLEGDPDMTGSVTLSEDGCTALFDALRQQGFEEDIFAGSCSKYVEELDSSASAGTVNVPRTWLYSALDHAPDETAKQLEDFAKAMEAVDHGEALEARAVYSFSGLVTLAEALGDVEGEITADSAKQALSAVVDKKMFLGPTITCDGQQWPGRPTACSSQSIFFVVQEDGSYKPGDPDGFVDISQDIIDTLS